MKETLFWIASIALFIVSVFISWNKFAYRDIELLKKEAPKHLIDLGFTLDGYNGFLGNYYYGGKVFYLCHRKEQPLIIYEIEIVEWRGEIQSYKPDVVNTNMVMD